MSLTRPHTAKSVFFGCIDDRLIDTDTEFIKSLTGGAFHPCMAGGGAAFLSEGGREAALAQIIAAYKINHVTDVYLESHTDCGAYRLAGVTFESANQETSHLYADLQRAASYIREALSKAGAADDEVAIHLRVVDPAGQLIEELQPA